MYAHIYQGNCIHGLRKYIEDDSIDLIIADPPFAIKGDTFEAMYNRKTEHVFEGYEEHVEKDYAYFTYRWLTEAVRTLKPGGSLYVVSGYSHLVDVLNILNTFDELQFRNHIIWKYNFGVWTTQKFVTSHYHILYYVKRGNPFTFNLECRYDVSEKDENGRSLNYQDREDVWIINREYHRGKRKNSNKLPQALIKKMILYSSNVGNVILDPFLGNMTTLEVALPLQRNVIGFEINSTAIQYGMKRVREDLRKNPLDITWNIEYI